MTSLSIHPLFLLMAVIGIVTGLYTLYIAVPVLMPVLLALSLVALLVRLAQLSREGRRRKDPGGAIRFDELHAKDLTSYAPWLKENVRGHDAAVDRIVSKLQQGLAVAAPHRTLGAFLLVGPTGTGKTFLGELLAQALYPDSEPVVLRMNQYKDHQDVFTLIGPPPGYQGYEVGGALTRPVLENPYRAVIMDEFEKSHADVRHCFYDILDRAQCQEKSSGKNVHFGATAFFATCNAGVDALRAVWRETADQATRTGRAREALAREGLERPLLARFDDILLMDQLRPVEIAEVACLQIAKHWRQYGIEVTYTAPELLLEALRRNVEFQEYGVRQLAHLLEDMTTPSIESARREGIVRVRLDLERGTGRITVSR
jgi:ATP-dependent Clp protease ATP-binding subunit ClpC